MAFKKTDSWGDEVFNAGTRGSFNPIRDLEKTLQRAIPELKAYNIMLCSEGDLNSATSMGWVFMDQADFGYKTIDDFNGAIGLKFGMQPDPSGHIKIGSNYILYMSKDYREKIKARRKEAYDDTQSRLDRSLAVSMPGDPRQGEMRKAAEEMQKKESTSYKVQAKGEPDRAEPDF